MKQTHVYKVDLTRINGSGEFFCPRCGAAISPDDDTEEAYLILGSKADDNGLEEMEIRCNKCSAHIHLTGFSLLQNLPRIGEESPDEKRAEAICYVAHI